MNKRILTYVLTIVLSAVFLFAFGSYASDGVEIFSGSVKTESAEIISVDSLTSILGYGIQADRDLKKWLKNRLRCN